VPCGGSLNIFSISAGTGWDVPTRLAYLKVPTSQPLSTCICLHNGNQLLSMEAKEVDYPVILTVFLFLAGTTILTWCFGIYPGSSGEADR
jgi:hypothetical protein